jgi:hypothetical protein
VDTARFAGAAQWLGSAILIAGALMAYLYLLDPSERAWGAEENPALKYLPVATCLASSPWLLLGNASALRSVRWAFLALLAGTAFVLAGSLYTIAALGAPPSDSLMGRGIPMLGLIPSYLAATNPRSRKMVAGFLWRAGLALSLAIVAGLAVWQVLSVHFVDRPHIYHEEIFLPVAAATAVYVSRRLLPPLRWILIATLLSSGAISLKNTGFLATALAIGAMVVVTWRSRGHSGMGRLARNLSLAFGLLLVALGASAAALNSPEALPDGSPELRLVTYPTRLAEFAASPLYGRLFTGSPFMELGDRLVQSHSDLLDIAALGGLVGMLLLVVPFISILAKIPSQIRRCYRDREPAEAFMLALTPLILMESLVNPIWHQPSTMILFWMSATFVLTGWRSHHSDGEPSRNRQPL